MTQRWYCQTFHGPLGPLSDRELKDAAAAGALQPHDLVRPSESDDWIPAVELHGLFSRTHALSDGTENLRATRAALGYARMEKTLGTMAIGLAFCLFVIAWVFSYLAIDWGGEGAKPRCVIGWEKNALWASGLSLCFLLPLIINCARMRFSTPKGQRNGGIPSYLPATLLMVFSLGLIAFSWGYPNWRHRVYVAEEKHQQALFTASSAESKRRQAELQAKARRPITTDTPSGPTDPIYQTDGALLITTEYSARAASKWLEEHGNEGTPADTFNAAPETTNATWKPDYSNIPELNGKARWVELPEESIRSPRRVLVSRSGKWIYIVDVPPHKSLAHLAKLHQLDVEALAWKRSIPIPEHEVASSAAGLVLRRNNTLTLLDADSLEPIGKPFTAAESAPIVSSSSSRYGYAIENGRLSIYDFEARKLVHIIDFNQERGPQFADRLKLAHNRARLSMIGQAKGLLIQASEATERYPTTVLRIDGEKLYWAGALPKKPAAFTSRTVLSSPRMPYIAESSVRGSSFPHSARESQREPFTQLATAAGYTDWAFNSKPGVRLFAIDDLTEPVSASISLNHLDTSLAQNAWIDTNSKTLIAPNRRGGYDSRTMELKILDINDSASLNVSIGAPGLSSSQTEQVPSSTSIRLAMTTRTANISGKNYFVVIDLPKDLSLSTASNTTDERPVNEALAPPQRYDSGTPSHGYGGGYGGGYGNPTASGSSGGGYGAPKDYAEEKYEDHVGETYRGYSGPAQGGSPGYGTSSPPTPSESSPSHP